MSEVITNPVIKYEQKPTRAYAIKAKCAECVGCTKEATEPGFRQLIKECASTECPLFRFRPYQ
jgi:hypothetical protein